MVNANLESANGTPIGPQDPNAKITCRKCGRSTYYKVCAPYCSQDCQGKPKGKPGMYSSPRRRKSKGPAETIPEGFPEVVLKPGDDYWTVQRRFKRMLREARAAESVTRVEVVA